MRLADRVCAKLAIERGARIPTWFRVGGGADALARPHDESALRELLQQAHGERIRVLGDGANLLVDDDGVDGVVVSLKKLNSVEFRAGGVVVAGAGVNLPRLLLDCVRRGLGGVEGLGGVPATLGGAVRMNAGGAFGEIGDVVTRVRAMTSEGEIVELARDEVGFAYRSTRLDGLIVLGAELGLTPGDAAALRDRLKDVMSRKKATQPLGERSAGCAFKNPTVEGVRRGAGMLIDRAGCKGLRVGGAEVSRRHANFVTVDAGATARDVLALLDEVARRVFDHSAVTLEREVVVWRRGEA